MSSHGKLLIYTISFKIPVYINFSSQNLHSAIAALKQEAKPLTTLNIKGLRQGEGVGARGGKGAGGFNRNVSNT